MKASNDGLEKCGICGDGGHTAFACPNTTPPQSKSTKLDELDKILEKYPFGGEWEDWKSLKADLRALIESKVLEGRGSMQELLDAWTLTHKPNQELRAGEVYDWLEMYRMGQNLTELEATPTSKEDE